jgi:hypothetical protein
LDDLGEEATGNSGGAGVTEALIRDDPVPGRAVIPDRRVVISDQVLGGTQHFGDQPVPSTVEGGMVALPE